MPSAERIGNLGEPDVEILENMRANDNRKPDGVTGQNPLQLQERLQQRLGQDIHDDLCQRLYSIKALCFSLKRDLENGSTQSAHQVGFIEQNIDDVIRYCGDIAKFQAAIDLKNGGVKEAIKGLLRHFQEYHNVVAASAIDPTMELNEADKALQVFRIVQEALSNAIRHGRATSVRVILKQKDNLGSLVVEDNGIGITYSKDLPEKGLGLRIMRRRANRLGGSFYIERRKERGTTVTCLFPV